MASTKILVVDDEVGILTFLQEWLQEVGYEVHTASGGWEALQIFSRELPTLSIVDLRMPGMDGFQLIGHIRELSNSYILALTGLNEEEHVVRALEAGADEYLVKPVKMREFQARVNSLVRRAEEPVEAPTSYSDDFLSINLLTREASVLGNPLQLRPTEFQLISFLAFNRDRVIGHQELLARVWNDSGGSMDSLKWYVSSLRTKIRDHYADQRVILTVSRVGYRYRPPVGEN